MNSYSPIYFIIEQEREMGKVGLYTYYNGIVLSEVKIFGAIVDFRSEFIFIFHRECRRAVKILQKKSGEIAGGVETAAEHEFLNGDRGVNNVHEDVVFLFLYQPLLCVHAEFMGESIEKGCFGHAYQVCQLVHIACLRIVLQDFASKFQIFSDDVVIN